MNVRIIPGLLLLSLAASCSQVDPSLVDKISQRTHWLRDRVRLLEEELGTTKRRIERIQTRYIDLDTRHKRLDLEFKLIQSKVKPFKEFGDKQKIEEKIFDLVTRMRTSDEKEWPKLLKEIRRHGHLVVPALLQAYRDGSFQKAGEALLTIGDPLALLPLVAALDTVETRGIAIEALGQLGEKDAIEYLVPFLKLEDDALQMRVAISLGELGDLSGIPILIAGLDHKDYANRILANDKLVRLTKADMGFHPEDNKDKRKPAVAKWKSWWRKNKDRFELAHDGSEKKSPEKKPGGEKLPGEKAPGDGKTE